MTERESFTLSIDNHSMISTMKSTWKSHNICWLDFLSSSFTQRIASKRLTESEFAPATATSNHGALNATMHGHKRPEQFEADHLSNKTMQLWLFRLGYIKGYTTQLHWDYNESLLGMFFLAPRLFNHLKGYSLVVEQTGLHLNHGIRCS